VRDRDPKHHLLASVLADNLDAGRALETAILSGKRAVSYAELAAAIVRGAAEIDERFPREARVLIASKDQLRVAVALCAAMQSHAVPLLVDPTSPERLQAIATEWRVAGALDTECVGAWLEESPPGGFDFTPRAVSSDEPAFWTFTSGTTGEPRAVVHCHRGPRAAFDAFGRHVVAFGPEDVTISTAGLPFVYALGNNFFFPLMAGGTVILPSDLLLPTVLGELSRHGATLLVAGPWSLAGIVRLASRSAWLDAIGRLRCVLSAGEPLPARVFVEWKERFGKEVLDNLGCTEMFNSFVSNRPGRARPGSLGEPVPGFDLRVGEGSPTPGARGELRVRGESRAIALGREGTLAPPAGEWCETGDEVEVGRDRSLVFLGRLDARVKVKGQFVHPVDVERRLGEVEGVAEWAIVVERDASGLTVLVAKLVAAEGASRADLVRRFLRRARTRLEPFAVPARVDLVDALPRNVRGKLERRVVER